VPDKQPTLCIISPPGLPKKAIDQGPESYLRDHYKASLANGRLTLYALTPLPTQG
jgi:hypothetical protein